MMTIVKKTFIYITIIGLIGVSAWFVFGEQNSFIVREYYGSLQWFKFDTHGYLVNLQNTLQQNFIQMPNMPSMPTYGTIDVVTAGFTAIIKTLFLVINWIIYILNITVLIPVKFIAYTFTVILSILGINMGNTRVIMQALYQFNVGYIPYIV